MKRSIKIAATTAAAVSSAMLVKKAKENKVEEKENTYRNTELGKHDKNSKGIIIQMVTMKHLLDLKNLKV